MAKWFEVDKSGLAAILERRGKAFAVFEAVSNAFDSGAAAVRVSIEPNPNSPTIRLAVEDDGEGFASLDEAVTLFARSRRAGDASKRGRFNLGEKLILAACVDARIETTCGTLVLSDDGNRRLGKAGRDRGTKLTANMRMTRAEMTDCLASVQRIIPPAGVALTVDALSIEGDGIAIPRPDVLTIFRVKLPTEIADDSGNLRRSVREAEVEVYAAEEGAGEVLELGIPIQSLDCPWRLNVLQKVPLGFDRDAITDAFRRALVVAATNAMADSITPEQAAEPWAAEAMGDGRAQPETVKAIMVKRFGDRAVVAVPGDPVANANASAQGYTVIHGGTLSAGAWANVRKANAVPTSAQLFPTPSAEDRAKQVATATACPLCGK